MRQAVAHHGRSHVRHMIERGRWSSPCRGVVVTAPGPLGRPQHVWVAVLAAGPGAILGGLAAAIDGGLRRARSSRIDILIPQHRAAPDLLQRLPFGMPAVFVHRTRTLAPEDVQQGFPTRTTMPRSLVDAAGWAGTADDAQAILAKGCQQRLTTAAELLAVVERLPRASRRRLIIETLADIAGGATALSEIDFLRLCRHARLPAPDLQERRVDRDGRLRYLDAYWKQFRLHVEVDGAHHMDAAQWQADLARQNAVWLEGDRILRFTAFQVRHRPDAVLAQLRAALLAAGWAEP
jgi:very-short-patch-repair endonuclease